MNSRTIILIVVMIILTVFSTAFAMINYSNTVIVWPWMNSHPLTLVIAVSFFLGAAIGCLVLTLFNHQRANISPPGVNENMPERTESKREHAGKV